MQALDTRSAVLKCGRGVVDLAHTGQEDEHVAIVCGERVLDGGADPICERAAACGARIANIDGEGSPQTLDEFRVENLRPARRVQGGGHGHQPEVGP